MIESVDEALGGFSTAESEQDACAHRSDVNKNKDGDVSDLDVEDSLHSVLC